MVIKLLTIDLHFPGRSSLKEKRFVLSSVKAKLARHNVAVAEVAYQDKWQRALLAIVTVGTDRAIVESTVHRVIELLEKDHRLSILEAREEIR